MENPCAWSLTCVRVRAFHSGCRCMRYNGVIVNTRVIFTGKKAVPPPPHQEELFHCHASGGIQHADFPPPEARDNYSPPPPRHDDRKRNEWTARERAKFHKIPTTMPAAPQSMSGSGEHGKGHDFFFSNGAGKATEKRGLGIQQVNHRGIPVNTESRCHIPAAGKGFIPSPQPYLPRQI